MEYPTSKLQFWIFLGVMSVCGNAYSAEPVPVTHTGVPLFDQFDPKSKASKNFSGLTCFNAVDCLVVADEMIAIQLFKLNQDGDGFSITAGQEISSAFGALCRDISNKKKCEEVDLEGVTRVGGEILVTGSMGNKKKSGKLAESRWFFSRITLNGSFDDPLVDIKSATLSAHLRKQFENHAELQPFIQRPLQCNGLNIEGLARIEKTVFFGLRSPVGKKEGQAFLVSSDVQNLDPGASQISPSKLHTLEFKDSDGEIISNVGIRALEELDNRLLIVTGDQAVSAPEKFKHWKHIIGHCDGVLGDKENLNIVFGKNAKSRIWIWNPDDGTQPQLVATIDGKYKRKKLEGLAVIGRNGVAVDLLLAFDDPKKSEALAVLVNVIVPE
jgi:hypothetical protein